jgi:hypothetical protein
MGVTGQILTSGGGEIILAGSGGGA